MDKSVERVQTKLASMLNRLELEIQSVEQRIGDKMHVLDRDSDGMVSAEEIAHVVQHVLATKSTEMEAKAIAEDVSMSCYCLPRCCSGWGRVMEYCRPIRTSKSCLCVHMLAARSSRCMGIRWCIPPRV